MRSGRRFISHAHSNSIVAGAKSSPLFRVSTITLLVGLALNLPHAAHAASCTSNASKDWMVVSDQFAPDIRPRDCSTVQQSPPDFRWPDVASSGAYQVTLTYPDGHTKTLTAGQNWLNWTEVLPVGTYTWTVTNPGGTVSAPRTFIVDGNSQPFLVPSMSSLISSVSAKPHPRSLPDAPTLATMQSQRASAVSQLLNDVSGHFNQWLPTPGTTADDAWTYSKLALASLQACIFSNQDSYCQDAIRRVTNLASWDPNGPTAYTNAPMDMASRYLTWTVALGYDWLYPRLSGDQRNQLLTMLDVRTAQMYNDLIGSGRSRIADAPRDSHANQTLSYLGLIPALLVGDLPDANTWMQNALPLALNATNPWGGEEGGFVNATTQGNWDVGELLPIWFQLRNATGVDVAQKGWVRNWQKYFSYFTPPGMSGGSTEFGDGFEENETEHQSRFGKAYTYFAPTPLGRWQASQLNGEDPTRIEFLMSPPADFSGSQPFPSGTPNSLYLPSIGEVAMHSDLSSTARTSVYFKSSPAPYGAYNHSHADQNSFVINAGGQRLAIESGYYDDYKTPHWFGWYHTTQAKNAITYDGGQGQLFFEANDQMGYGAVTNFVTTPSYDIVTGDATPSYGGALSKAQRTLVYLRPNLVLVYDNLASATSRQWEWNIHALNQMSVTSNTQVSIQNNGQKMCISMLASPGVNFTQTNQFTVNPNGSWAPQWHGRFATTAKQSAAEFVTLLDVGCSGAAASATKNNGAWTIPVGSQTVTIDANGHASVGAPSGGAASSGTAPTLPATIEAENFDLGGEGVGYHDTTPGNLGGLYRPDEDVDIIASTDTGGGYVVNNFAQGEWLTYTVNAPSAGQYTAQLRVSSNYAMPPAFHVEVDGVAVTGPIQVPNTGDWTTFTWVATPAFNMSAGKHVVKVVADAPYFNFNTLSISGPAAMASGGGTSSGTATSTSASTPSTSSSSTSTTVASTSTSTTATPSGTSVTSPAAPPSVSTTVAVSTPFGGSPIALPGNFEAENFDLGGEGVGYHDSTPGNQGGLYRTSEDVDIVASTDSAGGGYVINNFTTGEWLNYTVNATANANYTVQLRVANNYMNGTPAFHIEVDGNPVTPSVTVPNTGGWSNFQWVAAPAFPLAAGTHVLRVVVDQQYFNFNSANVISSPLSTPYGGTPAAMPGSVDAVNFDRGGEGVAYHDLTPGNQGGQYRTAEDVDIIASTDSVGDGYAINGFMTGEWLNYTVNVAASGNYTVQLRTSNNYMNATPAFHVEIDGKPVTASVTVPNTGGWSNFQWISTPAIALSAGTHVVRIVADQQYFNLDSIAIQAAS